MLIPYTDTYPCNVSSRWIYTFNQVFCDLPEKLVPMEIYEPISAAVWIQYSLHLLRFKFLYFVGRVFMFNRSFRGDVTVVQLYTDTGTGTLVTCYNDECGWGYSLNALIALVVLISRSYLNCYKTRQECHQGVHQLIYWLWSLQRVDSHPSILIM